MRSFLRFPLLAVLTTACVGSNQKPFDQMTAAEHLQAAAVENQKADADFAKITGVGIDPAETTPTWDIYDWAYRESGGAIPYTYDEGNYYDIGAPESYVAWGRISDPSEKYEDAASKHRENALRHERAAAALEGKPSPQPLPPPSPPLIEPERG